MYPLAPPASYILGGGCGRSGLLSVLCPRAKYAATEGPARPGRLVGQKSYIPAPICTGQQRLNARNVCRDYHSACLKREGDLGGRGHGKGCVFVCVLFIIIILVCVSLGVILTTFLFNIFIFTENTFFCVPRAKGHGNRVSKEGRDGGMCVIKKPYLTGD